MRRRRRRGKKIRPQSDESLDDFDAVEIRRGKSTKYSTAPESCDDVYIYRHCQKSTVLIYIYALRFINLIHDYL